MDVRVEIIPCDETLPSCLLAKWQEGLHAANNFHAILQSPEWLTYRWKPLTKIMLAVLRDPTNTALAVTPLVCNKFPLDFSVAGKTLATIEIDGYHLVGNVPLFQNLTVFYQALINSIFDAPHIRCLYIKGAANDSPFHNILGSTQNSRTKLFAYNPYHKKNRYFFIEMPSSYDEYCKRFSRKALYNMKRELRLLEKQAGGRLDLIKVTKPDQVAAFLAEARRIAKKAYQHRFVDLDVDQPGDRQGLLEAMARQGVLRAYLLKCGRQASAYVIGLQFNGVFYFHETAYDKAWARQSPGKTLLQLILKECFESETPRIFYFTGGDALYKKSFSNCVEDKITLLVLRRNLTNRLLVMVHRLFCSTVSAVKESIEAIFDAIRSKRKKLEH